MTELGLHRPHTESVTPTGIFSMTNTLERDNASTVAGILDVNADQDAVRVKVLEQRYTLALGAIFLKYNKIIHHHMREASTLEQERILLVETNKRELQRISDEHKERERIIAQEKKEFDIKMKEKLEDRRRDPSFHGAQEYIALMRQDTDFFMETNRRSIDSFMQKIAEERLLQDSFRKQESSLLSQMRVLGQKKGQAEYQLTIESISLDKDFGMIRMHTADAYLYRGSLGDFLGESKKQAMEYQEFLERLDTIIASQENNITSEDTDTLAVLQVLIARNTSIQSGLRISTLPKEAIAEAERKNHEELLAAMKALFSETTNIGDIPCFFYEQLNYPKDRYSRSDYAAQRRMKEVYTENYQHDPELLAFIMKTFDDYFSDGADFHTLYFDQKNSTNFKDSKENMIAFVRFSDLPREGNKKIRYMGAANVDPSFQNAGASLLFKQAIREEFESGTDSIDIVVIPGSPAETIWQKYGFKLTKTGDPAFRRKNGEVCTLNHYRLERANYTFMKEEQR